MNFVLRQTIAHDLLAEISGLLQSAEVLDMHVRQSVLQKASKLETQDAAASSLVKAAVYAIDWDFEQADYWMKNSLKLEQSAFNHLNAALTYKILGRVDLAAESAKRAYDLAPTDIEVVENAVEFLTWYGNFAGANAIYLHALDKGIWRSAHLDYDFGPHLSYMSDAGLTEEQIRFEVQAAHTVLAKNKRRFVGGQVELFVDHEQDATLSIRVEFIGDIQEQIRFESELAVVFSDYQNWNPNKLSTEISYVVANDYQPA
jgi:tetratricopeptide (TPR) repeat protein